MAVGGDAWPRATLSRLLRILRQGGGEIIVTDNFKNAKTKTILRETQVVVAGGATGASFEDEGSDSAEVYDSREDAWRAVTALPHRQGEFAKNN